MKENKGKMRAKIMSVQFHFFHKQKKESQVRKDMRVKIL